MYLCIYYVLNRLFGAMSKFDYIFECLVFYCIESFYSKSCFAKLVTLTTRTVLHVNRRTRRLLEVTDLLDFTP